MCRWLDLLLLLIGADYRLLLGWVRLRLRRLTQRERLRAGLDIEVVDVVVVYDVCHLGSSRRVSPTCRVLRLIVEVCLLSTLVLLSLLAHMTR